MPTCSAPLHVSEAIDALGYLKPRCIPQLAALLDQNPSVHPTELGRMYRSALPQLNADEKRAAGINGRAKFSVTALADLTEKGRQSPIKAFEITLLRAAFSKFWCEAILSGRNMAADYYSVSGVDPTCPGCRRIGKARWSENQVALLPPPDCVREACTVHAMPQIDFLKGIT